jgi:hypothetical protein
MLDFLKGYDPDHHILITYKQLFYLQQFTQFQIGYQPYTRRREKSAFFDCPVSDPIVTSFSLEVKQLFGFINIFVF